MFKRIEVFVLSVCLMKEDRLVTMVIVQSMRERLGVSSRHSAKSI